MGTRLNIEPDENMNHTVLRLFVENTELFRKDFSNLIESNAYATLRRTKKHMRNMKKIIRELNLIIKYREEEIIEARWGGDVPKRAIMDKKKSNNEPLLL